MATKKINYKDKSPLQTKPEIPEENKVNAEDLNQIKEVVNNNADEIELRQLKEEGKGLSKNDFTDELKAKLEGLNNYNDTEIKKEISEINKKVAENTENDIKQDNEILELKTNYTKLQEQNTKLENQIKKDRENMINLEVEGQSIHIEDSSDLEGQLEVLGNVEQDVTENSPSPEYPSEIRAVGDKGSVEIKKTTANYYDARNYNGTKPSHATVDKNDWITIIGNNTGNSIIYLNYFTKNLDLVIGKEYWIVTEIKSVSGEGKFSITTNSGGNGQFSPNFKQIAELKKEEKLIFKATAQKSAGHGLRTVITLESGQACNITFRISVLETDPNKSNWKYVPYKKETYILPIQKPMLEGDYFVKVADGWKEVHNYGYVNTKGDAEITVAKSSIGSTDNFFRYNVYIHKAANKKDGTSLKIFCSHFLYGDSRWSKKEAICGWETGRSFCIGTFNKELDTAEKMKNFLLQNDIKTYYELATPIKLHCTLEQTEILDELDNFQTYKPVTNITTDSIAKLKLKYIADTKTYVDNKYNGLAQQILNLAGGNNNV